MSENGQEKRGTLAAIAAELRDEAARADMEQYYTLDDAAESMREYAERIEAIDSADAWRSLYAPPVGNAAALRKAMIEIDRVVFDKRRHTKEEVEAHRLATEALTVPPRQCDVGTPEEQAERFRNFCKMDYISEDCPDDCPLYRKDCSTIRCPFAWAQTPYTERGENNE